MKCIVLARPGVVALEDRPEPGLQAADDVIVRVTAAGICGSDLHIVSGRDRGCRSGTIMGHELVGVVDQVGGAIRAFQRGDRVVAPFTVNCGACFFCTRGLTGRCEHSQGFGFVTDDGRGLPGAQAERVRVPLAPSTLVKVPDTKQDGTPLTDVEALFLGDILSTAYSAVKGAAISPGDVVAVIGCGPVGLLAVQAAQLQRPAAIVAVDPVVERRARAAAFGATAVEPTEARAVIDQLTAGRGADAAVEAVGTTPALDAAIALVRAGAVVSIAGYHTAETYPFAIQAAYGKNLTIRIGRCHARATLVDVLPLVLAGQLRPEGVLSHLLPLRDGVEAYDLFERRAATKVVLRP
jgi:threonine dehydrogenase-like Zn-dependent dehydrogenase